MIEQLNTPDYWNGKWAKKETSGKWGEKGYHFLKDLLPEKESFTALDIGCGRGAGLSYLINYFPKAQFVGVDYSQTAIDFAKEKLKGSTAFLFVDDAYKYVGGNFDYVFLIEILEHLRWPEKVLENYLPIFNKAIYISIPEHTMKCKEHLYAYPKTVNPFEGYGAKFLGQIDGRRKYVIEKVNK